MFSRLAGALLLSSALITTVQAQEQRYVEDTRAVPLREAAGLDQKTVLDLPKRIYGLNTIRKVE